jgi:hypothetical protein
MKELTLYNKLEQQYPERAKLIQDARSLIGYELTDENIDNQIMYGDPRGRKSFGEWRSAQELGEEPVAPEELRYASILKKFIQSARVA